MLLLFFNYMHTLGCIPCAAVYSPIQALRAGEEHLIKVRNWALFSLIPLQFLEHFSALRASSFALICAAMVLCRCLSKKSMNMGTTVISAPNTALFHPNQDEMRTDPTLCDVWGQNYNFLKFYFIACYYCRVNLSGSLRWWSVYVLGVLPEDRERPTQLADSSVAPVSHFWDSGKQGPADQALL